MSVSTVPAALDALVAGLSAALPDVQVVDGQPVTTEGPLVGLICVGFGGVDGEPGVESTRTREQLTAEPDRERYDIVCLASSWSGDTDAKTVRDRAYELVDAIATWIAAHPDLGGAVMDASLAADALTQSQTAEGAVADVRFIVRVDAYTTG